VLDLPRDRAVPQRGLGWLEVECHRCKSWVSLPLTTFAGRSIRRYGNVRLAEMPIVQERSPCAAGAHDQAKRKAGDAGDLIECGPQPIKQAKPGLRQRHASCRAVQQSCAEPRLKLLDRVADCGRGQLQSLGRGAKTQVLGHEKEGALRSGRAARSISKSP
jgi:hypothetical protein